MPFAYLDQGSLQNQLDKIGLEPKKLFAQIDMDQWYEGYNWFSFAV